MRTVFRSWSPLALAALILPGTLSAQDAILRVRVITEARAAIENANVYINDLAISVLTSANGIAVLTVPAARVKGQNANLRVRAVGYVPQVQIIRVTAGPQEFTFQLKQEINRLEEVLVSGPEGVEKRSKVSFDAARAQQTAKAVEVPGSADPFARFLFPPELVMQHQSALGLTESQREALQTAIRETQNHVLRFQWALAQEGEKLTKLLDNAVLNESEVLAQVDRIIGAEREIKRTHMTLMIKIKNTLTAAQQERLQTLRE
jgi:Spy/CpxP family protein refolding chaperone